LVNQMNAKLTRYEPYNKMQNCTQTCQNEILSTENKQGLTRVSVLGDGNCFFTAVVCSMMKNIEEWKPVMSLAGVPDVLLSQSSEITATFRKVLNRAYYEEFIVNIPAWET